MARVYAFIIRDSITNSELFLVRESSVMICMIAAVSGVSSLAIVVGALIFLECLMNSSLDYASSFLLA